MEYQNFISETVVNLILKYDAVLNAINNDIVN